MIITPDFVCIHLQKCGGSFVREFLLQTIPGAFYTGTPHDRACDIPIEHSNKPILGMIRNPWAWYVSWYAGTQRNSKGHFWELHPKGAKTTFAEFIATIRLLKRPIHNIDFGLINRLGIGVYTYRYINSYCRNIDNILSQRSTADQIDKAMFDVHLCRTEHLREDIIKFMGNRLTSAQHNELKLKPKVNTSSHNAYQDYYTPEINQWVASRDKYIIDKFGYEFDFYRRVK